MTQKYGLYVGINKHSDAPLYGCVNDAIKMHKTDMEVFGFSKDNTVLLLDEYANKENVIRSMLGIFDRAKKDDIIRLHFSTHGTQFPDTSGDEADFVDEALVMFTPKGKVWWKDSIIRDDDFDYVIRHRMKSGVRLICTFDCCHTGTGLRMIADTKVENSATYLVRYMPPPPELATQILEIAMENADYKESEEKNLDSVQLSRTAILNVINGVFDKTYPSIYGTNDKESSLYKSIDQNKTVQLKGEAILYSGCLSTEVSYDITRNGIAQGAMSSAFTESIHNLKHKYFTYQELYDEMISIMTQKHDYPKQHPQLELDANLRNEKYLY